MELAQLKNTVRIAKCELFRLQTPFRRTFKHAAAERSHGDAIIVNVVTENGVHGFGEIQARPYVTGENNDDIWQTLAPGIANDLVGCVVSTRQEVYEQLGASGAYEERPALVGGFDIAVLNALELEHGLDWPKIFGPARQRKAEKCLTVGEDYSGDDLRNQARLARLGGYAVVKLKISGVEDVARIADLRQWVGDDIALRLDANGQLVFSSASELLDQCAGYGIESIEEPLNKSAPDLVRELTELYRKTGVALMADESICTEADLARFAGKGAYQIVNIRIGKCGGISGAAAVLKAALNAGLSIASGTMVGETSVMLRASRKMLAYCNELKYVEGLDQSKKLLQAQALVNVDGNPSRHFEWLADIARKYVVGSKTAE